MKPLYLATTALLTALLAIPAHVAAQSGPDGTSISQAIPIYFGQTVNDIGDSKQVPNKIYSVTLAKGQQFNIVGSAPGSPSWYIGLLAPGALTLPNSNQPLVFTSPYGPYNSSSLSLTYQVAAAGTYYIWLAFGSTGVNYSLQITATGTPISVPNPTSAGCLTGQVDYLTYSLQLIAAGLPDTASIGGTQMCAACTVKPPAYPILVSKMETAMSLNVGVSACYDATGNIFQLKLMHP